MIWPASSQCCYLNGEPRELRFCGEPVERRGYCGKHYDICYVKKIVRDPPVDGYVFVNISITAETRTG